MASDGQFTLTLVQQQDYQFLAQFDNSAVPPLLLDASTPLGQDQGPNASRLLVTAVADCLATSLLFALRKFHYDPTAIQAVATATIGRNADKRQRITTIEVMLTLGQPAANFPELPRILAQFENFCTVSASVGAAIDIRTQVQDSDGVVVKAV